MAAPSCVMTPLQEIKNDPLMEKKKKSSIMGVFWRSVSCNSPYNESNQMLITGFIVKKKNHFMFVLTQCKHNAVVSYESSHQCEGN